MKNVSAKLYFDLLFHRKMSWVMDIILFRDGAVEICITKFLGNTILINQTK